MRGCRVGFSVEGPTAEKGKTNGQIRVSASSSREMSMGEVNVSSAASPEVRIRDRLGSGRNGCGY